MRVFLASVMIVGLLVPISFGYAQTVPTSPPPKIDLIEVPPQVGLGQEFAVTVKVADAVELEQVEVRFNGKVHRQPAQGSKEAVYTFTLKAEESGEQMVEATAIDKNKVRSRIAVVVISVKGGALEPAKSG
jgi:hypothetical protein